MVTAANTEATLSAQFKEIYGDSYENLIPDGVKLIKKVPFKAGDKELGDRFVQPVQLSHEHGFSYGTGVFSLEEPNPAQYQEAQVVGNSLLLRTAISYGAAARMSNSKKAFVKWSELVVKSMVNSMSKRLEIQALYGQSDDGLGTVNGNAAGVLTIDTAQWAPGIWAGSENMEVDVYDATGVTLRNTVGALVISAVDLAARTVTVTGDAGDIAAVAATDVIYFRNAKGNEAAGADKIITNTGTLFNIDASAYSLWKGNSYPAGGAALTFAKLQGGIALAVNKGLEEDVCVMVSAATWSNLMSDQAALREYDSKYSKMEMENGAESIKFHSQNGSLEIVPSIYIKEGEAIALPPKRCMRLGSTDVTFRLPGKSEEEIFLQLPSQAGYELRSYTEQTFFCESPGRTVKFTGIVNS
jgi:hypothetical protein